MSPAQPFPSVADGTLSLSLLSWLPASVLDPSSLAGRLAPGVLALPAQTHAPTSHSDVAAHAHASTAALRLPSARAKLPSVGGRCGCVRSTV